MMTKNDRYGPYNTSNIHPGFSVDCVILGFHKGKLRILLNKFDVITKWMLPGGFMLHSENAEQAAYRVLKTRTGLEDTYLRQFYLFSDINRTDMEENKEMAKKLWPNHDSSWMIQRFVTLGYLALVKYKDVNVLKIEGDELQWHEIDKLPPLYSDHENIIRTAFDHLRNMIPVIPVGPALLPEHFTMTELRRIFEIFSGTTYDRRNFQRKILAEEYVIPVERVNTSENENTYNAPIMYKFNPKKKSPFHKRLF